MDLEKVKSKIITVQGQQVILDSDVAGLYGVETKRVNETVGNSHGKKLLNSAGGAVTNQC
jgi:hypothetical protein